MAENFYGITDTGRQRTNNEDAFIAQPVGNKGYLMACVIDGVGGYEGGEVAAELARQTILHYFSIPSGDVITMMQEALLAAHEKIRIEKEKNSRLQSMACVVTLAIADVTNNQFYYAHVGDTRLYLYRDGALVKITKDHSFVGFLEDNGRITEEAAMLHPKRNEIDKALGFENSVNLSTNDIEVGKSPFLPGDSLLLCSDGLSDMLTTAEITALYQHGKTLADKGKALIDAANKKGGKDNITVVLVHNNSKPLKQKATKPAVVKKKYPPKGAQQSPPQKAEPVVQPEKRKSYKGVAIGLGVICVALVGALAYLLWPKGKLNVLTETPAVFEQTNEERLLVDTLSKSTGIYLGLTDAYFGGHITLTDTLLLAKDSFRLSGSGTTVLEAAPQYRGAALQISKGITNIFIDSLILKNFNVGILPNGAVLHLKGVRFINCAQPIQYTLNFPDSMAVTGMLRNGVFIQADSSNKTTNH